MINPTSGAQVLHIAWVRWWSALAYYALSLAKGLNAIGVPSKIVAPPGSPLAVRAEALGLLDRHWNGLASARPDRFLGATLALRRAVAAGSVKAVFAHTGVGHTSAALALRGRQAPLLRVRAEIRPPSRGAAQRWLYTRATDRILISGEFMRAVAFETIGVDPARIVTLPAGIDCKHAASVDRPATRRRLRTGLSWPLDAPVVGMLARYSPVKGYRDLVDAARILSDRERDLRFYCAGPPGQTGRDQVEAWVRKAGLSERFAILDEVSDPLTVAAGFDIAVIASRGSEAVCRSALEYMAIGLPIVATRVNVIPETLGDAGLLVPPEDPGELAGAIGQLLADPERSRLIGEAAAERARVEFDRGVIAKRAAKVLTEVIKERSAR